ncbi:MAG: hypothetical protein FRX49_10497 [Trebouxia sp. A1-2]|nr:MAG: hypothetical protein FRX49_10497 [Trebouxia sp. A1-2]
MGELRSNHYAAPATADFPEPLQASLSLAHKFIAQGNTTAALQPQQASSQSAADQLADILTGCRIADNQQAPAFAAQTGGTCESSLNTHMQQLQIQGQHRQRSQVQQPLLMAGRQAGRKAGKQLVPVGINLSQSSGGHSLCIRTFKITIFNHKTPQNGCKLADLPTQDTATDTFQASEDCKVVHPPKIPS